MTSIINDVFNLIIEDVIQEWGLKEEEHDYCYFAPVHNEASKRFQERYNLNYWEMGLLRRKAEQEGWFDALGYHPYSGSNDTIGNFLEDEFDNISHADYLEWCRINDSEVAGEQDVVLFQDTSDGPHEFNI